MKQNPVLVPRSRSARPSRPGTAQDHAAEWMTQAIIAGELAPGDHVPQEEIAKLIGVSLIPVRESMRRLEGKGLLTYRQQLGYFVAELTVEELIPMFELRALLEDYAVRKSIPLITDDEVDNVAKLAADCNAALEDNDIVALAMGHWEFYSAVLGGDDQSLVLRLLRQLWERTHAYAGSFYSTDQGALGTQRARANILQGLRERNVTAVIDALAEHRDRTQATLLKFVKGN